MEEKNRAKADVLRSLNQKIQEIQGFNSKPSLDAISLHPDIDKSFPNGAFPIGAVHEFSDDRERPASAMGFMAAIMSLVSPGKPALWITKSNEIFPPGLTMFGLAPHRIIFMKVRKDQEVLWAMEEGLRCKALSVTVAEIADADLTATRRLQLAVEHSGVTGFLLRHGSKKYGSSACFSSWKVRSLPSRLEDGLPGVGFPRWSVELKKIRNGRPGIWELEWKGGQFHLIKDIKLERMRPELRSHA